jgi:hypothetical protein
LEELPKVPKVAPRLEEELCKAGVRFGKSFMAISRLVRSGSEKNTATFEVRLPYGEAQRASTQL